MNRTVRSVIAGMFLYLLTLIPHMAMAYLHRRFSVAAVVSAHTVALALAALVFAFALLAAKR